MVNYSMVGQMAGMGYNPRMLVMGPGTANGSFPNAMGGDGGLQQGDKMVQGIYSFGAWSIHSTPELAALRDKLLAIPGFTESNMDYWGHGFYYAGLQVLEQAIEKAGSLDNQKVAAAIKTEHFDTVLGDTWFDGQWLAVASSPGQIGQWQNGVFEVIDVGAKRTAAPIYPKPAWPAS